MLRWDRAEGPQASVCEVPQSAVQVEPAAEDIKLPRVLAALAILGQAIGGLTIFGGAIALAGVAIVAYANEIGGKPPKVGASFARSSQATRLP